MQPPLTRVDTPHCPSRVGEEGKFQKTAALPGRPASGNTQALEFWLGGCFPILSSQSSAGATVNLALFLRMHPERDGVRQGWGGPGLPSLGPMLDFLSVTQKKDEIFVPLIPHSDLSS